MKQILALIVLGAVAVGCSGGEELVGDGTKSSSSNVDVNAPKNERNLKVGMSDANGQPTMQKGSSDGLQSN